MTYPFVSFRKEFSRNTQNHVTQDYRGHNAVVVTHSNVAFENLVVPTQSLRPLRQLRLAKGWDGIVRDIIFWNTNMSGDGGSYKCIHGVKTELLEHVRGLPGVWANVSIRKGVEGGEGRGICGR